MTPRSTATLFALSGLTALYMRAYKTAAGCALLASYAALPSIKELPKKRPAKRLVRSQSAPELRSQETKLLRSVEVISSAHLKVPPKGSLPLRRSRFESWGVDLSRGRRKVCDGGWLHLPTTPLQEVGRFRRIDLTTLPNRSASFSERVLPLFGKAKLRSRGEIVDGIVDICDVSSPLWQKLFPNENPSLEIGDIEGAAGRTAMRGGGWIVITHDWNVAQEVRRGRGDRGWTAPLIIRGSCWQWTHFYIDLLLKRIDVRSLKSPFPLCQDLILLLASTLQEDGELRWIFRRGDQSNIDRCKERFKQLSFAPPQELLVDEELVEDGLLGRKVTLSEQLHLIYRGVK